MTRLLLLCTVMLTLPVAEAGAVLTLTGPAVADFADVQLNGRTPQTSTASVGTWSVNATGHLTGWHVDVGATRFEAPDGSTLPLGSMTYKGPTVAGASGQLLTQYPLILVSRPADPPR
jgi:hypothetical protein